MALLFGVLVLVSRDGRVGPPSDPVSFPAVDYEPSRFPAPAWPRIGTNYTHYSFAHCTGDSKSILQEYGRPEVARAVHDQLGIMRRSGVDALRLLIWHMTDLPGQSWGPIPSRGGRLPEPYRANLVAYLREVRRFGFARLTVSFGPLWANNPRHPDHDVRKLDENWAFLRDIRALVKEYGPPESHFDLLNEGAPSDHGPPAVKRRLTLYLGEMYSRYVLEFGKDDVVVSVIAPRSERDRGHRLRNLIDIFASSGHGQPNWYEVHLNFAPQEVFYGLSKVDEVLTAHRLDQPLVIGEAPYDDFEVARAIDRFSAERRRAIDEITQWYKAPHQRCNVSPPYSAAAYLDLRSRG